MSFAFLRRVNDEISVLDGAASGRVSVNTHVTSSEQLADAIESIKAELESRKIASPAVLNDKLDHISAEVEANAPVPLALEHLELYQARSNSPLDLPHTTLSRVKFCLVPPH